MEVLAVWSKVIFRGSGNSMKIDFQLKDNNIFLFDSEEGHHYGVWNNIVQTNMVPINTHQQNIMVGEDLKMNVYL